MSALRARYHLLAGRGCRLTGSSLAPRAIAVPTVVSSQALGVIAKIDVAEAEGGFAPRTIATCADRQGWRNTLKNPR